MKTALAIAAGAIVGNYIAERFVLKSNETDPTGFVMVADGFGADDLARAGCILVATLALLKVSKVTGA